MWVYSSGHSGDSPVYSAVSRKALFQYKCKDCLFVSASNAFGEALAEKSLQLGGGHRQWVAERMLIFLDICGDIP